MAHLSSSLNPLSLQSRAGFQPLFNHTLPLLPILCPPSPSPLLPPLEVVVYSTFTQGFHPAPSYYWLSCFLKCCRSLAPSGAAKQLHSFGRPRTASCRYEPAFPSLCAAAEPLSSGWPQTSPHQAGSYGLIHALLRWPRIDKGKE